MLQEQALAGARADGEVAIAFLRVVPGDLREEFAAGPDVSF